jgi:hypothetical protein
MADEQRDDSSHEELAHTSDGVVMGLEAPAQNQISAHKAHIQALLAKYAGAYSVTQGEFNMELERQKLTPLLWSVQQGEVELVRELLATGHIDVNMRTAEGANALFLCVLTAEAERADTAVMAKSFEQDLSSNSLKYPFEEIVLLLLGAGASWATVLDDNKLLQCESWTALSYHPDVIRCICRKHAEAAAAKNNKQVAEYALQVQHKDRELAVMREVKRLTDRATLIAECVIFPVLLIVSLSSAAVLTGLVELR